MYVPNGTATTSRIEREPFDAWVELPEVQRNALTPYAARSVRDLRGLGDVTVLQMPGKRDPSALIAHRGVPRWPGRASIFNSKPTYGWALGDEERPDPMVVDALFWAKAGVAALATVAGLYVLSRI